MATATSVRSPESVVGSAGAASVSSVVGRMTSASSVIGRALSSAMVRPAKVTAKASRRSPVPWHSGQGPERTNWRTLFRIIWLFESERVWKTYCFALQNMPLYGFATRSRCGVICTTGCSSVKRIQSRSS